MKSMFIRSADFELRDDGRTLSGRIVPYNEIANVAEYDEESKAMVRYQETFLPHSLAAMTQGFNARGGKTASGYFIPLLIDHNDNFDNMIGHATELRDADDGAYASFRLYDAENITKIRSVLSESHTGLSISFRDVREPKLIEGIVSRVQVFVAHVAATPSPAYSGASIMEMRSNPEMDYGQTPNLSDVKAWLSEMRKPTVNVD